MPIAYLLSSYALFARFVLSSRGQVGASVTPALFLAGFSLRSAIIQRVFAILELLRAVAAFMIAPILLHFATTLTGQPTPAMGTALWITFGLAVGGALAGIVLSCSAERGQ
jgi:hypothetical protein